MSNNKNYKDIVNKRKATIQKKREAKVAKKQDILQKLENDIEYLQKVKATVEKRQDTISKKQFIKDLMTAGDAYSQEKQNKTEVNSTIKLRDRKKYEKSIDNALESFKVVSFHDDLHYEVIQDGMRIKVPNIPVIKSLIESILRKQIE